MLAWVLNKPLLLLEDSANVSFLHYLLHYKTPEICYFYFFQFIKHAINHLISKPFDLLNTIPFSRTMKL